LLRPRVLAAFYEVPQRYHALVANDPEQPDDDIGFGPPWHLTSIDVYMGGLFGVAVTVTTAGVVYGPQ
jgi:hypothetical protein